MTPEARFEVRTLDARLDTEFIVDFEVPLAATTTAAEGLSSRGLVAGYGPVRILHGIDLAFRPGNLTALVGPNGCGKSTYLGTLARILKPTAGAALLDGHAIHALPTREVARHLALLPQNPITPEAITVYDLISRGRHPHQGMFRQWTEADAQAVESAMAHTGTAEFADRPVDSLSGGQRQRCWLAMTLAQEARILLLDEPTTFLDLRHQVEIMELLVRLKRDLQRTIVVVLHDLNFAAAYSDEVVMMKDGAVVAAGPTVQTFTAERVEAVFGVPVHVVRHPDTGRPWCLPKQDPAR